MMILKKIRLEHIAVLFAAILLVNMLLAKPIIGIADNGDFGRIMGSTGLKYIPQESRDRYFEFVNRLYRSTSPLDHYTGYFSSEIVLVLAAKLINNLLFPFNGTFDIRCLSYIYILIFLLSVYLIIRYTKSIKPLVNLLIAALIILIFTDTGYISYFNSLYGEALSFISLLSTIGFSFCLTRHPRPKVYMLIGYFISAASLTGAKLQNAPIGLILIFLGIRFTRIKKDKIWKRAATVSSILIIFITAISYLTIPGDIRICNKYQSVFFGILKGSDTPQQDLQELGIDPDLAVLAGTNYFMRKYPMDIRNPAISYEVNSRVNPLKVAAFYMKHPVRYIKKLDTTAYNSFKLIQGFGNYEKVNSNGSKRIVKILRIWSDFKMRVMPHSLLIIVMLFVCYFIVLSIYLIQSKNVSRRIYLEVFIVIGMIGITQFMIPIIGDGEADLSKHLFLFNVCFDLMFITSIVWSANTAAGLFKRTISRFRVRRIGIRSS